LSLGVPIHDTYRIAEVFVDQEEGELKDAHGDAQAEGPVEVCLAPHVPGNREPHLMFSLGLLKDI